MNLVLPLQSIHEKDRARVGGKGFALAMMTRKGLVVPDALCVTVEAYQNYIMGTVLQDQIVLELHRKVFEDMRWEEIWDVSLRIRNLFLKTALPKDLADGLSDLIRDKFAGKPVTVRSSAPGEDSSKTSFAGLHESYVNVSGIEMILKHIRLVWASLWSDRALLYRKELGLDVETSTMAVVVQEMVPSDRSGVVFGMSPVNETEALIEAVYGMNQGLVDGTVEPDRWVLDRKTGRIITHTPAARDKALYPAPEGLRLQPISLDKRDKMPLSEQDISEVFNTALKTESLFGTPQDVEWTFQNDRLYTLQARPITTLSMTDGDQRPWYVSLKRSFDNLKELRKKIENKLIPDMAAAAEMLASRDFLELSDPDLAEEIEHRNLEYEKWIAAYREDCIPFAHGMRLFGQIYNDVMGPKDPFEFMDLLVGANLISKNRNQVLSDMAAWLRGNPQDLENLKNNRLEDCTPSFLETYRRFNKAFSGLPWQGEPYHPDAGRLVDLLVEMVSSPPAKKGSGKKDSTMLVEAFLSKFEEEERARALEMIDIARASYQLRDDDNIFLARIEKQLMAPIEEAQRRIELDTKSDIGHLETGELVEVLRGEKTVQEIPVVQQKITDRGEFRLRARQLVGQPAGPGLSYGKARVVLDNDQLFNFKAGEILVCDAIDPNMTFVVPMAAGIVERRGGMLIHGAIIAREYGLPCVTGVPDATSLIKTGDDITVDGFLGIVIIGKPTLSGEEND